jgi:hypothetical protein
MFKLFSLQIFLLFLFLSSCSDPKTTEKAYNYNQFIYKTIDPVLDKMIAFEMAAFDEDTGKLEEIRKELISVIDQSVSSIKKTEVFDGNEDFKNSALDILNFYKQVSANEYLEIIKLVRKLTPDEKELKIYDIVNVIYQKENEFYFKFETESGKFAEKYGFKVEATLLNFD